MDICQLAQEQKKKPHLLEYKYLQKYNVKHFYLFCFTKIICVRNEKFPYFFYALNCIVVVVVVARVQYKIYFPFRMQKSDKNACSTHIAAHVSNLLYIYNTFFKKQIATLTYASCHNLCIPNVRCAHTDHFLFSQMFPRPSRRIVTHDYVLRCRLIHNKTIYFIYLYLF